MFGMPGTFAATESHNKRIVLPVGVIGGEANACSTIELVQHAIGDAAFILPDVD